MLSLARMPLTRVALGVFALAALAAAAAIQFDEEPAPPTPRGLLADDVVPCLEMPPARSEPTPAIEREAAYRPAPAPRAAQSVLVAYRPLQQPACARGRCYLPAPTPLPPPRIDAPGSRPSAPASHATARDFRRPLLHPRHWEHRPVRRGLKAVGRLVLRPFRRGC